MGKSLRSGRVAEHHRRTRQREIPLHKARIAALAQSLSETIARDPPQPQTTEPVPMQADSQSNPSTVSKPTPMETDATGKVSKPKSLPKKILKKKQQSKARKANKKGRFTL
ncbi:hypothetical protein GEMRC1_001236 [Eukaryota sp. GEM-RC1]